MILTLFESVRQAYTRPEQIIEADWPYIADILTTFKQVKNKEDALLFNLWSFNINGEPGRKAIWKNGQPTEDYELIPGTIRRCKANALGATGLTLDYDGHKTIDEAVAELDGLTYALYTTFRHSAEKHKFRIVLPFDKLLDRESFEAKKDDISACFPFADYASFSESQSFYLHSGPTEESAIAFYTNAAFLDPDYFENTPEPEPKELSRTEFTGSAVKYKDTLLKSLMTCKGLHYNGPHKFNVLTLVSLCKTAGISFEEYDSLCYQISDPTSTLREPRYRQIAWQGWGSTMGVTREKREAFIASHGGRSYFSRPEQPKTAAQLREYVINKYGKGNNNG